MKIEELEDKRRILTNEIIDGERFSKVVETWIRDDSDRLFTVCTAVHRQGFDRRIGGVRIVREAFPESYRELGELAEAMTWKSALCGLPADGEKTIVYCHGSVPRTVEEKASVVAVHLRVLREEDPGVIFGPDMDCDERVMDALAHDHGLGDNVSGLTEGRGGFSIDDHGFTARGLEAAMTSAAKILAWDLSRMTMVVQGFGAVGAHTARLLADHGVKVVAASTKYGALYAEAGLPIGDLFQAWKKAKDDGFREFLKAPPAGVEVLRATEDLFKVKTNIFVPAARTDVLRMPDELRDAVDNTSSSVVEFRTSSGLTVVLEGANHPLSDRAEKYLMDDGVYVLPDYLVNCGGLIGCWIDWCYRANLLASRDGFQESLVARAVSYIQETISSNLKRILDTSADDTNDMRSRTNALAREARKETQESFELLRRADRGKVDRARAKEVLEARLRQSIATT